MSHQMDWRSAPELAGHAHSALFAQELSNDSNRAMDWLWLASQLDDAIERQYCLKCAHYIDPDSVAVEYPNQGLIMKLKDRFHRILTKRTASAGESEEQLATSF